MALIGSGINENTSAANVTVDREACQKFWIAAYTRPKSEKKAASEIENLGIETYLPVQTEIRQWSDRKKKIDVVVIPNVIFIHLEDKDISIVRQHSLIIRILTLPGRKQPAHIPSEQIDNLKFMLSESDSSVIFCPYEFKEKDNVKVIRGNLKGLRGIVQRISDSKSTLTICIDFLGGAMVELPNADLEIINH